MDSLIKRRHLAGGIADILDDLKTDSDIVTQKQYNKAGSLTKTIDAEGYPQEFNLNAFEEVIEEKHCVTSKTADCVTAHSIDVRGNAIETVISAPNETPIVSKKQFNNPLGKCTQITSVLGAVTDIQRDGLGREIETLTQVDEQTITTKTTWDSYDNLASQTNALDETTLHHYERASRKHTLINPLGEVGNIYQANSFGDIIQRADALGNASTFTHNGEGALSTETNPLAAKKQTHFNARNAKIKEIDADGIETQFIRDDLGQITQQIDDAQGFKNINGYQYNALTQPQNIKTPRGIIKQQEHNKNNALIKVVIDPTEDAYPGLDLITTLTPNAQNQTSYLQKGNLKNPNLYDKKIGIDNYGRKQGAIIDPEGLQLKTFEKLNAAGQTIAYTDAENATTWHLYNALGQKRFEVSPLGAVKEWIYDVQGQITQGISYDTGLTAEQLAKINEKTTPSMLSIQLQANSKRDNCLCYFYDACGRERFAVTLLWNEYEQKLQGLVTEKQYDIASREIKTLHYANPIPADTLKTATLKQVEQWVANIAVATKDAALWTLRDAAGQIRFTIDADNFIIENRFDKKGLVIAKIRYANAVADAQSLANLSIEEVDSHLQKDPLRDRAIYRYFDALERCIFEVKGEGAVIGYQYDKASNCINECRYSEKTPFPESYERVFAAIETWTPNPKQDRIQTATFDANNRCIAKTDARGFTEQFMPDALGNIKTRIDKKNNLWLSDFDRANRLWQTTSPDFGVTQIDNIQGKLVNQAPVLTKKVTKKILNKRGQITGEILGANTKEARTLFMHLNVCGNLTGTTIPQVPVDNGTPITLGYRPETNQDVTTAIVYNARQRKIASQDEAGNWTYFIRDNLGRLTYKVLANGAVIYKGRNTEGLVNQEIHFANPFIFPAEPSRINIQTLSAFHHENSLDDNNRSTRYERDRRGNPVLISKGMVYDFPMGYLDTLASGVQSLERKPAKKIAIFNAFGEVELTGTQLSANATRRQLSWFDREGNLLIQAKNQQASNQNDSYTMEASTYNTFNERSTCRQFAKPLIAPTLNNQTTLAQISDWLATQFTPNDRLISWQYNAKGKPCAKYHHKVKREKASRNAEGLISFTTLPYDALLMENIDYDALDNPEVTTDAEGNKKYAYHNALSQVIAETDFTQTNLGYGASVTPLRYLYRNIHGEVVSTIRYKLGTNPNTLKRGALPEPILSNEDPQEMRLFDIRGKIAIEQDPNGNQNASSFTLAGNIARSWHKTTNWLQSTTEKTLFTDITCLDIKAFTYTSVGLAHCEKILRDNVIVQSLYTDFNLFNQPISRGRTLEEKVDFIRYDTLGHPWFYHKNGVPTIAFHNFLGMEVYSADSPIVGFIESLSYPDLATVVSDVRLERTLKARDLEGRMCDIDFPTGLVTKPAIMPIPLDTCVGSHYPELGKISLSWPKVQEQSLTAVFRMQVLGNTTHHELPIATVNTRSGVDLTAFASDIYQYQIDYFFIPPALDGRTPTPVKKGQSQGQFYLLSLNNEQSQHCVPYFIGKGLVGFAGKTEGLTQVEVWQNDVRIGQPLPVINNTIDMNAFPSGVYNFKTLTQTLSMPIRVFSKLPAPPTAPALSYEIPAAFTINTLANHGGLDWTLPEIYAENNVILTCVYEDNEEVKHTESWTINKNTPLTEYTDAKGKKLLSNLSFAHPLQILIEASLHLQIKTAQGLEEIPLYQQQKPALFTPIAPDLIHAYPYPDTLTVYLKPFYGLTAKPNVSYLNTNLGSQAAPTEIPATGFTTEGFSLNVTGFPLGKYPLVVNDHNDSCLEILQDSVCFLDGFGAAPPEQSEKLDPKNTILIMTSGIIKPWRKML